MARAKSPASIIAPKLQLPPQAIERGLVRLEERIGELEGFDVRTLVEGRSPEITSLEVAIKDTLERCFGEGTSAYNRFQSASHLQFYTLMAGYGVVDYESPTRQNIANAIALLKEAQRTLREDLADHEHAATLDTPVTVNNVQRVLLRKVFVVHGHDEGAREAVARFLMQLGFDPIILHEQANQGRTVMEKVEAHGDVGFAVVLLTPDDEGCVRGGTLEPRARQNVLLELGYFLGRLGRDKVCALKRGTVEIPSDFAGVVWESMDSGNNWKQALGRELQAAGHEIDWNKVMRA
ncbi:MULTISPECIES: TIR domain-containing protein [Pseudomonas syringae group]|uniref:Nucleotide-binding protein n=2 Tax=Pseudomonas syringae group TaxID=136849 RepID=A0A9X0KVL1_PSESX|nr:MULTISPECIES: nucleotide-binding protein [Pseudomonas syringae group]KPX10777.1 Nucleotide-binding protein [Pseudomonas syringae pv. daphniphylli]KPX31084.1 hypothetical protein ALO69_200110 [Pseudomonas ficuserectae]KWS84434.1 nucleotide-binding protein [Pseudomonas syringae pv. daphniphylli]RMO82525.1 hypothetical protein ALQ33_200040 [Pseudomonas syringae pv. philadelphi]RMS30969.1 hypothetical protein ALP68_200241 [Pseudomonas ficuserectae]